MSEALVTGIALAWLTILGIAWLGWQLLRQNGRLLLRLDELEERLNELEFGQGEGPAGLPLGSEAPAFELPDLEGKSRMLAEFRGQPLLLIFFNPDCGFCREMMPKLAALPHPQPLSHPMGEGGQGPRSSGRESAPFEIALERSQSGLTSAAPNQEGNGEDHPSLVIVTTSGVEKNRRFFAEHKVDCPVLLQRDGEVAAAYQTRGTPSGCLISPDGKIASELAMGAEALLALAQGKAEGRKQKAEMESKAAELVEEVTASEDARANRFRERSLARSKLERDGLKAGTPAPDFRLPRLDGRGDLTLSELRGKRVLLVFSSPNCGPCNTLAPELEKFHRQNPELELVMISKGEPQENRAKVKEHHLTFPVVLQQQWEISRRYAMFATPIAYVIDEEGLTKKDVAVGVDQILALMDVASHQLNTRETILG